MSLAVEYYFLVEPDWADGLRYRRRWRTSIQSGITGFEIRSKLYTWPRRSIDYSIGAIGNDETSYLKRKLFKSMSGVAGVPFWQDETTLTAQANSGQAVLNVGSTENRNFEVGGQCILIQDQSSFEVGNIQSKTSDSITLSSNLAYTWPAGTRVYPVLKARIDRGFTAEAKTGSVWTARIRFNEAFDEDITHYVGSMPARFQSFGDYKVMDIEPDGGTVSQSMHKPFTLTEFLGAQYTYSLYDETVFKFTGEFSFFDRSDLQEFLDFFDAMAGRWGAFWLPTNVIDVRISLPFSSTDKRITVNDGDAFKDFWLDTNAGRNIIIFWPDGTFACGEVIEVEGNELILYEPIGKEATSGQVDYLVTCFLPLARFDQDEIEVDFFTTNVGRIKTRFKSLRWDMPAHTTTTTTTTTTSTTTTSTTT